MDGTPEGIQADRHHGGRLESRETLAYAASTFGSDVYPWEIQVMSVQSEAVSRGFGFVMVLATGSI
jgi:hypothetical protein